MSGGAERKLLLIYHALKKYYDIKIVTFIVDKKKCFPELTKNIKFIEVGYGKNILSKILSLFRMAKMGEKADIIHSSNFPSNIAAAIAKKRYGPKIMWFCNEPMLHLEGTKKRKNRYKLKLMQIIEKMFSKRIDLIIANSEFTKNMIKETMGLDSKLIYSGVDTDYYKRKNIEKKDNTVFFISRIEKEKNVGFLLELAQDMKEIEFIIGGDGLYNEELKKKAPKNVKFLGRISEEEKREWYSKASVFAFPTFNEPLGVVPMESMACELPVVAFSSGGCKETIKDGETGFLCKNEKEFKQNLILLLKDAKLRENMGKMGRKRVIAFFSVKSMIDNTEKMYKELLNRK